jgi:hypothetical protein
MIAARPLTTQRIFHASVTFAAAAPSSMDGRYVWEGSSPFAMTGRRLPSGATCSGLAAG